MKKTTKDFKMGVNWGKQFLNPKRVNAGWKLVNNNDGTQTMVTPDNKPFALFNPKTGIVTTTKNVMDIQW